MGQDATEMVLKTSVLGTFRVFVVMLVGLLASKLPKREPLLTRETCRTISRVCTLLFLPSLVLSSTGSTLTPSTLRDSWQLVFAAGFTILMSAATAWVFGRAFLKPEDRRAFLPVQLAISFQTSVVFPLLLMDALCQQDTLNSDFDGDPEECFTRATDMIFIYSIVWQILFYTWGFPSLGRNNTLELKLAGPSDGSGASTAVVDGLISTERTSVLSCKEDLRNNSTQKTDDAGGNVAIDIELCNDTSVSIPTTEGRDGPSNRRVTGNHEERDPASTPEAATSTVAADARESRKFFQGQTEVPTFAVESVGRESSGTVADGGGMEAAGKNEIGETLSSTVEDGARVGRFQAIDRHVREVLLSPNIIAVFFGIVISLFPSLQDMIFNNTQAALWPLGAALQTVGTPTVAVSTLVMAGSLVQVPMVAAAANRERTWSHYRIIMGALHVGCRLIVFPAAGFALFWLAITQSTIMGSNRLMHVIILIEFTMPSAALIIMSLNQLKMPAAAGFMARLYVVQYGLSMLTISAWTTVALRMVY